MTTLRTFFMDPDRLSYLSVLRHAGRQYGLEIEIDPLPIPIPEWSAQRYGELVTSGQYDFAPESYYIMEMLAGAGEPLVALGAAVSHLNEQLFVGPGIESLEDLRGKRMAVRYSFPSGLVTEQWLADHGLAGGVEIVKAPDPEVGRWGQWKKVVEGEADACLITNLYARQTEEAGLHSIPIPDYGQLINVVLTTSRNLVQNRPEEARALVRAAFDVANLFKEDLSTVEQIVRDEVRPLVKAPFATVETDEDLSWVCRTLAEEMDAVPIPVPEAIVNFQRMWLSRYPEFATFNPLSFWDLSFAQEVAAENTQSVQFHDQDWGGLVLR